MASRQQLKFLWSSLANVEQYLQWHQVVWNEREGLLQSALLVSLEFNFLQRVPRGFRSSLVLESCCEVCAKSARVQTTCPSFVAV
eukprot:2228187-Amphidinium_carterae.1